MRFNQNIKRDPARRMQPARRASLETLGVNVAEIMERLGCGERRAMAEAERALCVHWHNGAFGLDAGHHHGAPR